MDNTKRKKIIIEDTGKYSLAQYATQGIGIFIAFFMRKFLGPYQMGIWSLLKVLQGYLSYLQLGVESAAVYRIPFYRGKGDTFSETETRNTAFTFMFMASLLSAIGLAVAAIVLRSHYSTEVIVGLLALALYMILQRLYSLYIVTLRAYRNFSILTKSLLFDAIVNLILVLLLVSEFKIYGLYITISILAILNTLFVSRLSGYKLEFKFAFRRFKELMGYGFPLLISGFLSEILATIDNVMIGAMLGVVFVGYYSIALMMKGCIYGLSNNLGIVTIPHMQEVYGKTGKVDDIKKFVTYSAESISYILTPLLGLVYFIVPFLVEKFLPKYVLGIPALQTLLLSTLFISCSTQTGQFLVTINRQLGLIVINIIAIVLNIGLNFYLIKTNHGINGVAFGTSLSSFFVFVAGIIMAMRHFARFRDMVKLIVSTMAPLVYVLLVIFLCKAYVVFPDRFLSLIVRLIILVVASTPLYLYIDRKTKIVSLVIDMILSRFKIKKGL